jgi:eukaryotic-like serine/threonine-protein kinase
MATSFEPFTPLTDVGLEDTPLQVGTVLGEFTLLRVLGAGSAGIAYVAEQPHPRRGVAVKVLRGRARADLLRRFEQEAEVLARLDHPGIATVYTACTGDAGTPPYIAMELVEGPPITEFVESASLGPAAILRLVAEVCDAVQHAHQRGVIHRDLKPANILVDLQGRPKVLDFGVARIVEPNLPLATLHTMTGQVVGTLPYMSPEQVGGDPRDVDTRTDIYALGVILYRLLAGRLPFELSTANLAEAARTICQREPPDLASLRPELAGDVSSIVSRAMARHKERRYESAASMAADLRRAAIGDPIEAHRDSAWSVLRSRLARYRLVTSAAAATSIVLMGLVGYAVVQRADARAAVEQVGRQLARSTVERGRLLARTANLPLAEELLWQQYLQHPSDLHARWGLRELYARYPSAWEAQLHAREVRSARLSADDRLALSAGADGRIVVLAARDGSSVASWLDHPGGVAAAGFVGVGQQVYSVGVDGRVLVRDTATGAVADEWRTPTAVHDADVSGSNRIALSLRGGSLHVASLGGQEGREVWRSPAGVELSGVVFSPDGRLVAVGDDRGGLTIVDAADGRVRWRRTDHGASVSRVAWSPDGQLVASGSGDRTARLWNAETGAPVAVLSSGNGSARTVAFSPDSRQLVVAGWWRVDLWDIGTQQLLAHDIGASQGWYDARFSASGDRLLLGSAQGSVRVWDLHPAIALQHGALEQPFSVSFDADRSALHVVVGRQDGLVTMFEPGTRGRQVRHGGTVHQVATDASGRRFVSVGSAPLMQAWELRGASLEPIITVDGGAAIGRAVAISRDGQRAAIGEEGGRLRVVDLANGTIVLDLDGHGADLLALRFDAAGHRLFTAYRDRRVLVREAPTGRVLSEFTSASAPFVLAYAETTGRLAAGAWAGGIDVWDVHAGTHIASLTGHARLVTDLDFAPAGSLLYSAGRDGTIRVWNTDEPGELALLLHRDVGGEGVRVIDDGERIAVLFEDGHTQIVDLARLDRRIEGHRQAQGTPRPARQ